MRILCPMCGFGRQIDDTKIPPRAQMATCPKCAHKFRFRVVDDLGSAPAVLSSSAPLNTTASPLPAGQDLSAAQPDPMAAQRAAAAEAWKRLQGPQAAPPSDAEKAAPQPPLLDNQPAAARTEAQGWPAPDASLSEGSPVPFEDLPRHGFFPGLWGTIRQVLTGPAAFFRAMPVSGGMGKPLAFHLLLAEFMLVSQYFWGLVGFGGTAEYLGSPELMDMGLGAAAAAPLFLLVLYPLLLVLRLMFMTGIIHLLLRLVRAGDSGAEATFRVLCYSAAPLLLGVIPVLGPLVGGVWSIGLTVLGLKEAHRTRYSAALFAVLVPILVMLAAVIGYLQGIIKAG